MDETILHDEEAEAAALGGIMLDANLLHWARAVLKLPARAFINNEYRLIYETMLEMGDEGRPIDLVTVAARIRTAGKEGQIQPLTIDRCVDKCVVPANGQGYLHIVREKYILRETVNVSQEIAAETRTCTDAVKLLSSVGGKYAGIIEEALPALDHKKIIADKIGEWEQADAARNFIGLATPFGFLNRALGGLQSGLYYLAGRPSEGKTTVEDQVSIYLAEAGRHVARATNDSTAKELFSRAICRKANVSLAKLNGGYAGEANFSAVHSAGEAIAQYPLHFMENARNLGQILGWARMMKARHDIALLTIDYVQNIFTGDVRTDLCENMRLTIVSSELKGLAFELGIPVLALSQLSRASVKDEREPRLDDIRGSGSLEQDATGVIFVYKDAEMAPKRNLAGYVTHLPVWLDVAKNKNGGHWKIPCWFAFHYFRFEETREWGHTEEEWKQIDGHFGRGQ